MFAGKGVVEAARQSAQEGVVYIRSLGETAQGSAARLTEAGKHFGAALGEVRCPGQFLSAQVDFAQACSRVAQDGLLDVTRLTQQSISSYVSKINQLLKSESGIAEVAPADVEAPVAAPKAEAKVTPADTVVPEEPKKAEPKKAEPKKAATRTRRTSAKGSSTKSQSAKSDTTATASKSAASEAKPETVADVAGKTVENVAQASAEVVPTLTSVAESAATEVAAVADAATAVVEATADAAVAKPAVEEKADEPAADKPQTAQ